MPDPIGAITGAISLTKELHDIAVRAKDIESQKRILELEKSLLEAEKEMHRLNRENFELSKKVEAVSSPAILEFRDGYYFKKSPAPGENPGPYCPKCWEIRKKTVSLVKPPGDLKYVHDWRCPECNNDY